MISDQQLLSDYVQLQREHRDTLEKLLETMQELTERQNERQQILGVVRKYFDSIQNLPVPPEVARSMSTFIEDIVACFSK